MQAGAERSEFLFFLRMLKNLQRFWVPCSEGMQLQSDNIFPGLGAVL
jgi:hypothetical protein